MEALMQDLAALLPRVEAAVRAVAAQEIMPRYLQVVREHKFDGSTLSEADLAAQHFLAQALSAIAPLPILGEEMGEAEQAAALKLGDEGLWCFDPIDGTTNFLVGMPLFAISVALLKHGRPVLGVLYAPVQDEMFTACLGGGAHMNGEPLPLRPSTCPLDHAVGLVDLKHIPQALSRELGLNAPYYSQRNLGSSVLEWSYLAAGRADIMLHGTQRIWDFSAGSLLLTEAGGAASTLDHDDFHDGPPWCRSVIACLNADLLPPWRQWIRKTLATS